MRLKSHSWKAFQLFYLGVATYRPKIHGSTEDTGNNQPGHAATQSKTPRTVTMPWIQVNKLDSRTQFVEDLFSFCNHHYLSLNFSFTIQKCLFMSILVGGLDHFLFFHSVGTFIIPTDELHHFSEGQVNHQPDHYYDKNHY